jgi:hypothetical protein
VILNLIASGIGGDRRRARELIRRLRAVGLKIVVDDAHRARGDALMAPRRHDPPPNLSSVDKIKFWPRSQLLRNLKEQSDE